jgi:tRNA A-37 threonylcarbamoyl transferase component Bud32
LEAAGHSREGEIVSHYRIVKRLGAGGMGEVYQAVDINLGRPAVLKFLLPHLWDDPRTRERFMREAKAASSLDHPNICTIYEIGYGSREDPFIAMAYYEGETLAQRIARQGPLPIEQVIDIGRQLAAGLAIAHQRGVIHRDVKPDNVMITSDGLAKILDFGVAKLREASSLTSTDAAVGTLLYMSPEQCQGLPAGERSDVWSLGTVLYEMATGERAFRGANIFVAAYEIANDDPIAVDQLRPAVPAPLKRIIERTLEKDPDARYPSMRELELDLLEIISPPPKPAPADPASAPSEQAPSEQAPPAARPRIARRSLAGAALLAGIVALLAFAGKAVYCGMDPSSAWCAAGVTAPLPAAAGAQPALDYWITVQRYRGGAPYREPFRLDREMVFESDYRIFLHFQTARAGNVYILNQGPASSGAAAGYNLLFPKVTLNGGDAFLPAASEIQIPESGGFVFDNEIGAETVWLVWSKQRVAALEAVRGRANERDLGVIDDPAETAAIAAVLAADEQNAAAEQLSAEQKTRLSAHGDLLVHRILLEHR